MSRSNDSSKTPSIEDCCTVLPVFEHCPGAEGGDTRDLHKKGIESVLSVLNGESQYRTMFSFDDIPSPAGSLVEGKVTLDFLELYAFDLFCHWNLDRMDAVQQKLRLLDQVIEQLCEKAGRLGLGTLLLVDHGQERVRRTLDLYRILEESGAARDEYSFYIEVCNARFWFFTDRAREVLSKRLAQVEHATFLTAEEMGKYHIHFDASEGFGDAYLITDQGTVFFPHDFYHPLVNWYMGRKTPEQASRSQSPVHRGYHGHLPGHPADTGYLVPLNAEWSPLAERGQIIDFAPTILGLLGRPVPAQMQGKVLLQ